MARRKVGGRRRPARGAAGKDDSPQALERAGRVGLGILVLLAWVYALFGGEGLLRQWERHRELERARARLAAERLRTDDLRSRIEALRHDDLAIEREIRRQLDYQRPGELVLILGEDDPLAPGSARGTSAARRNPR